MSLSFLEAKNILESLANGIDPNTGEVLSDQSPFNNPKVIRALFLATKTLDNAGKREKRTKTLPDNAGKPWSETEEQELLSLFDTGLPITEIAAKYARTKGAIAARLVHLGRIKERAEVLSS